MQPVTERPGSLGGDERCDPLRRQCPSRRPLTLRQFAILDFIRACIQRRGYPPSIREIGEKFGIASTNGVSDHLWALEKRGYITREPMVARGIRLKRGA
jgi:SOS-response transcriptional repressor LexA